MVSSPECQHKQLYRDVVGGNRQVVLSVVEQYRIITAPLIQRLTELPLGSIQNILTRLSGERLVNEQRPSIYAPYWYWPKGKPVVKHVDHEMGLTQSRIGLTVGARRRNGGRGCLEDQEWIREGPVRKLEGAGKKPLIPDWSLVLVDAGRTLFGFWEEDLGTMRRRDDDYHEKFLRYLVWRKQWCADTGGVNPWGMKAFRVFVMTETDRRLQTLRQIAQHIVHSSLFWFTSRERWSLDASERLLTAPIWLTAKDDAPRLLVE